MGEIPGTFKIVSFVTRSEICSLVLYEDLGGHQRLSASIAVDSVTNQRDEEATGHSLSLATAYTQRIRQPERVEGGKSTRKLAAYCNTSRTSRQSIRQAYHSFSNRPTDEPT